MKRGGNHPKNSSRITVVRNFNSVNPNTVKKEVTPNLNFLGTWAANRFYYINNIVSHGHNLYITKKDIMSNTEPNKDLDNFQLFFSGMNLLNDIEPKFLYKYFKGFFTNGSCCFNYNSIKCLSEYNFKKCCNGHKKLQDSSIWATKEVLIESDQAINIPINFIVRNDLGIVNVDDKQNLKIGEIGSYKITYNITYHGSNDFSTKIVLADLDSTNELGEIIPFSINSCVNKLHDTAQILNHSFIFDFNSGIFKRFENGCHLLLVITPNSYDIDKKIYIYPLKTWLTIEKISN